MHILKKATLFLGRASLSLIFILSGIQKIFSWGITEEGTLSQLCEWRFYLLQSDALEWALEKIINWIPLFLALHIILELVGGLLVLLGIKIRLGVFCLLVALIPATLLFHNFWMLEGEAAELQKIMFLKNLSIFGGLLILFVLGNPHTKAHD